MVQNYLVTQREFSEGHEIACHTWSHPFLSTLGDESVYAELAWGCYAIHAAIGQFPKFFRSPYSDLNSRISGIAAQLGLQVHTYYIHLTVTDPVIKPTALLVGVAALFIDELFANLLHCTKNPSAL